MAAKPVVDGFDKQLAGKVRFVRVDVASPNGRKIAVKAGLGLVPTFIGYDAAGMQQWRVEGMPNKMALWRKIISL